MAGDILLNIYRDQYMYYLTKRYAKTTNSTGPGVLRCAAHKLILFFSITSNENEGLELE